MQSLKRYSFLALVARILMILMLFGSLVIQPQPGRAAPIGTFTVDVMTDLSGSNDVLPGDGYCLTSGGDCTLRAAIQESNAMVGENTIIFDPGVTTVILQSALPSLNDTSGGTKIYGGEAYVYIQGTLAGSTTNGFVLDSNSNKIQGLDIVDFGGNGLVINGDSNIIGADGDGVTDAAEHNVIRENSLNGIQLNFGADNNRIAGNRIGVDRSGAAKGNLLNGIQLGGNGNRVGVVGDGISDAVEGNIISQNEQDGIDITGSSNIIAGNTITTNTKNGIDLFGCNLNLIGTNGNGIADAAEGNLISGNLDYGIYIYQANEITIAGNRIGTDATGTTKQTNFDGGIYLWDGYANLIGTDGAGSGASAEGNLISGNTNFGIQLYQADGNSIAGNKIGSDVTGTSAIANYDGIQVRESYYNTIGTNGDGVGDTIERNTISGNTAIGIEVYGAGATDNIIAGNVVGLDASGSVALPNGEHGLMLANSANLNRVGTDGNGMSDEAERNIISGNTLCGIYIDGNQNRVAGNTIGLNLNGNAAIANHTYGICLYDAVANTIGSNGDGSGDSWEGNVISGNMNGGIVLGITADASVANGFYGNWIGTSASGVATLGNIGPGITLQNVEDNRIGYNTANMGNVIVYNQGAGILFTSLTNMTGNQFVGNSMYENQFGIDLGGDGVTYNDVSDGDPGPNGLLNFPVLQGAESTGDSISIAVAYNSAPNKNYVLDFYWSGTCHSSGHGEGEVYLGWDNVTTDGSGAALKQVGLAVVNIQPGYITATAMDSDGSTSEFSACIPVEEATFMIRLPLIMR